MLGSKNLQRSAESTAQSSQVCLRFPFLRSRSGVIGVSTIHQNGFFGAKVRPSSVHLHIGVEYLLEDFTTLCFVRADLSPLSGSAQPKSGKAGKMYWTIVFSIEIHFGLTEFKARIKWNDNVSVKSTNLDAQTQQNQILKGKSQIVSSSISILICPKLNIFSTADRRPSSTTKVEPKRRKKRQTLGLKTNTRPNNLGSHRELRRGHPQSRPRPQEQGPLHLPLTI